MAEGDNRVGGIAGDILRSYIERIERLEEEKKDLSTDIREIYAEAKGNGFDAKIMRKVVARRRMKDHERIEEDELLDLYERAISRQIDMFEGGTVSVSAVNPGGDLHNTLVAEAPADPMTIPPFLDRNRAEALGKQAFIDGLALTDNPNTPGLPLYQAWAKGWEAAASTDQTGDADPAAPEAA